MSEHTGGLLMSQYACSWHSRTMRSAFRLCLEALNTHHTVSYCACCWVFSIVSECACERTWVALWLASPQSPRCGWSSCAARCTSPIKVEGRRSWRKNKNNCWEARGLGLRKVMTSRAGLTYYCIIYSPHTISLPFHIPSALPAFLCSF